MVNLATLLQLTRPLAIADLETTGLNPDTDRITQIGITIHYPHREPIAWVTLVDPERPIPKELVEKIHITDEMVKGQPKFSQIAPALAPKLTNIDIGGYHVEFDIAFLEAEMRRANVAWKFEGHIIDALQIFRRKRPHNLMGAYKAYVDDDGFKNAHDAGSDVGATEAVLAGQLRTHSDLPRTVKALSDWCFPNQLSGLDRAGKLEWDHYGVCCLTFGKYKTLSLQRIAETDSGYLNWCINGNFPEDFKSILRQALLGEYPVKPR